MTHVHDRDGRRLCPKLNHVPPVSSVALDLALDNYRNGTLGRLVDCTSCCEAVRRAAQRRERGGTMAERDRIERCERCNKPIKPDRLVTLEMDCRDGTYQSIRKGASRSE